MLGDLVARNDEVDGFPSEVADAIGHYVYRLIDPRNGETFYVGKGRGNRVFAHVRGERQAGDDDQSDKVQRIRDILNSGFKVAHVIHRHNLADDALAYEVEAALIDAYPGTANIAGGHGSDDFGPMHAQQIIDRYRAETAEFSHPLLIISINQMALERGNYDATRYAWKLDPVRARKAEFVLATIRGVIVEVFVAESWLESSPSNFPGFSELPGRWGFVGRLAPDEIREKYRQRKLPDSLRRKGAANPIRYVGV